MRRTIRISVLTSLIVLSIGLATSSTVQGQAIDSVGTFRTIRAVSLDDCDERLKVALERLDKTLDAFEKSERALSAALDEIEARKKLDDLKNDWIKVKDNIIVAQAELIKFYQNQRKKGKWRSFFEKVEKVLILAAGILLGRGL